MTPEERQAIRERAEEWRRFVNPDVRVAAMDLLALDAELTRVEQERDESDAELDRYERFDRAIRDSANAMMREALGGEMYSRLWGYELERLGHAFDTVIAKRDRLREENARLREQIDADRVNRNRTYDAFECSLTDLRERLIDLRERAARVAERYCAHPHSLGRGKQLGDEIRALTLTTPTGEESSS